MAARMAAKIPSTVIQNADPHNESRLWTDLFGFSANTSLDITTSSLEYRVTVNAARTGGNLTSAGANMTHSDVNVTYSDDNLTYSDGLDIAHVFGMRFAPYTALSLCGFVFNLLSLSAMTKIRGHATVHHTLLRNLAVCDMIGSVLLWMYYNSPYIFPRFDITSLKHCVFLTLVLVAPFILTLCCSSMSLLLLALNQYVAICFPLFSATRMSRGRAVACIAGAWLLAAVLATIPCLLMLFMDRYEDCSHYAGAMAEKSLEICAYALTGLIVIIVALYARIYREVVTYRRRTPQLNRRTGGRADGTRSDTEGNYKAFVTTLLLSGTLILFWLPYMVFHFISAHVDISNSPDILWHIKFYVIDFMPTLNFLTDPLIYGIRMREIRDGYRRVFAVILPCCVREPRRIERSSVRFTTLTTSI